MTTRSFTVWRKFGISSQFSALSSQSQRFAPTENWSYTTTPAPAGPAFGRKFRSSLVPSHARVRFRLRKYLTGSHVRRRRRQHLFFPVNQIARTKTRQLESMAMGNRVGGASLHTVTAKYASIVVDVVDASVALSAGDSGFSGVFRGFYVDAISGTGGGAEKTRHTFFQAGFVALQDVHAAKTFLVTCAFQRARVGVISLDDGE